MRTEFTLRLPAWLAAGAPAWPPAAGTDLQTAQMRFVLELAQRNVDERTGGPFAAAVFIGAELVSAAVNVVVPQANSLGHAEVMAIGLAHAELGTFDLGERGCGLVTSSQMCTMCLGAVVWSGLSSVTFSATREDVESLIGFDEGPVPPDYPDQLARRGIAVTGEVNRHEGRAVLAGYRDLGGAVYNAHH